MNPLIPYFPIIRIQMPLPFEGNGSSLTIYGFYVTLIIGLICAYFFTIYRAKRLGLDYKVFDVALVWVIVGILIGGHIGYGLFYEPNAFLTDPILFLDISSGFSSFGGIISSMVALFIIFKYYKMPILKSFDCIVGGFSLGWFFGRIGCTLNHEHPGTPTQFFLGRFCRPVEGHTLELPPWLVETSYDLRFSHCIEAGKSVVSSYADKVPLDYPGVIAIHDVGFYEAIFSLVFFISFLLLDRKPRFDGFYLILILFTYLPIRFILDFLRPFEGNPRYFDLTPAQWCCALGCVLTFGYIVFHRLKHKRV